MTYDEQKLLTMKVTFFLIPVVVGLAFFGGASADLWRRAELHRHGRATTGTVTRVEHPSSTDSESTLYHISFRDQRGRVFHAQNRFHLDDARYAPHDSVRIVYDPADPGRYLLDDSTEANGPWLVVLVGAGILIGCGLGLKYVRFAV